MKVYYGLDKFQEVPFPVVTSGTFDGVHLGHQRILQRINELASKHRGESVVLTLWPHPKQVLQHSEVPISLLSSIEEKIHLLEKQGIDNLVIIPFTKAFSETSSADFIQNIIVDKLKTKVLVIGYDHRFGKNREGSFEYLTTHKDDYSFEIEEISKEEIDNSTISSTLIRQNILDGDLVNANKLLGTPYTISGKVILGEQIGRTINFPTANIQVMEHNKLLPHEGAYAVMVVTKNSRYQGMMNIGYRPTVNGKAKTIEVNIFDFDKDIYGQFIRLEIIQKIRNEKKFKNVEALSSQLKIDKSAAQKILKNYETV